MRTLHILKKATFQKRNGSQLLRRLFFLLAFFSTIHSISAQSHGAGGAGGGSAGGGAGGTEFVPPSISGELNPCPMNFYTYYVNNVPTTPSGYNNPSYTWVYVHGTGATGPFVTNSTSIRWAVTDPYTTGSATVTITYKSTGLNPDITYTATINVNILSMGTPAALSGPNSVVCGDQSFKTYSVPVISGATSYQWSLPAGWNFKAGSCQNCNQVVVYAPSNGQSGNICVAGKNSCGLTASRCIYVYNENPIPSFTATIGDVCTIAAHDFTVSIGSLSGATSYLWSVSGNTGVSIPGSKTGTSAIVHTNANINGPATVTITAYFAYSKTTQQSFVFGLTSHPPAQPVMDGDHIGCPSGQNGSIVISNRPMDIYASYSWTWSPRAGVKVIPSSTGANILPTSLGEYNIFATASNVCGDSPQSELYPYDILSCSRTTAVDKAEDVQKEISFYPNPASNSFELIIPSKGTAQVKLISLHGQLIKQFETNDQQTTLNVADVAPGMYILSITTNGESINKRIEIAK